MEQELDKNLVISEYLPVVQLELDGGSQGYVLAVFYDANGKPINNASRAIENGVFAKTAQNTGTLTCTRGLENEYVLSRYQAGGEDPWSVILKESSDNGTWSEIAHFYFPGELR